jgi:hypothetical protein
MPVNHLPQHGIRRPQRIISAPAGDRARMSRTQGNGRVPAGTAVAGWPGGADVSVFVLISGLMAPRVSRGRYSAERTPYLR